MCEACSGNTTNDGKTQLSVEEMAMFLVLCQPSREWTKNKTIRSMHAECACVIYHCYTCNGFVCCCSTLPGRDGNLAAVCARGITTCFSCAEVVAGGLLVLARWPGGFRESRMPSSTFGSDKYCDANRHDSIHERDKKPGATAQYTHTRHTCRCTGICHNNWLQLSRILKAWKGTCMM